ncbi:MAG: 16S rRNA (adenine(1518)-N(6)/adenine(1519)-N(6))-dimethyltransferase RsmA [Candidatus Micrarchaeia archaeon]
MVNEYLELARSIKPKRSLGQNFLINPEYAKMEARYGAGKRVLELGPGFGILTREICKVAERVVSVEKDPILYSLLSNSVDCHNLTIINKDFFELDDEYVKGLDILIANIPYNLSSNVIRWVVAHKMPALLCLQKEFVEHMLAERDTRKYSKLSVMVSLELSVYKIVDVKAGNFYPRPKVDSTIVFIKPKIHKPKAGIENIVAMLMNHKKKKLRNAIIDSSGSIGISREQAQKLSESIGIENERVFKLAPEKIEAVAEKIKDSIVGLDKKGQLKKSR